MNKLKKIDILICTFLLVNIFSYGQNLKQISINKKVFFPSNQYVIDSGALKVLDSLCRIPNVINIKISGYCDSIGSYESNLLLSKNRSSSVKQYLSQCIDSNLILTSGEGEEKPKDLGMDSISLAQNRRVDIKITYQPTINKIIQQKNKKDLIKYDSQTVSIHGRVTDENNKPLISSISVYDHQGKIVKKTSSNVTGEYNLSFKVANPNDYLVLITKDSFFVNSEKLTDYLKDTRPALRKQILRRIESGQSFIFKNLNFVGDTAQLIPTSIPLLENLVEVLYKDKKIRIQIDGHVNFPLKFRKEIDKPAMSKRYFPPGYSQRQFNQWLSDQRAEAIKSYLVKKGINPDRIKTLGHGSSRMLFPNPITEEEQELNRRVEIIIL